MVKEIFTLGQWPLAADAFNDYLKSWSDPPRPPGIGGFEEEQRVRYEVTATYLHIPGVACRAAQLFPRAKFVVVVRDPVKRALSHYNMWIYYYMQGIKQSPLLPFDMAMRYEVGKLRSVGCSFEQVGDSGKSWNDCFRCFYLRNNFTQVNQMCDDLNLRTTLPGETPCNPLIQIDHFLTYGMYAAPLRWWLKFFTKEQFLIVKDSDLKERPAEVGNRVSSLVGAPQVYTQDLVQAHEHELKGNPYKYIFKNSEPHMQRGIALLKEFYRPHMVDFYLLLKQYELPSVVFDDWDPAGPWSDWHEPAPVDTTVDMRRYRNQQFARAHGIQITSGQGSVVWQNQQFGGEELLRTNEVVLQSEKIRERKGGGGMGGV